MYEEALKAADIVGLCVGTRPDCVPDSVLDLLSDYVNQGYEIWLELGLQTANNDTLKRINRGHDFECYAEITQRARALGIKVCTHLIVGLPKETRDDNIETLQKCWPWALMASSYMACILWKAVRWRKLGELVD